jgi:hypothetical protein
MNKELYRLDLRNKEITNVLIGEDYVEIDFKESPSLKIKYFHSQDCCESVYADLTMLGYYIPALKGRTFSNLVVKGVKGMGFLLCFLNGGNSGLKIFIPCYNNQNGYYSTDLKLIISPGEGGKMEIDISDLEEDNIS